ncbi:hypothetical protein BMW23_0625 [Bodo saltans virus]|uniref:Uncharacterized protein n=1 Tax=Bodo saltans virus TaxID=2024608 RepID=A0A2H4UUR6_9VIRU|nr:hypothetical protein QJ851_gp0608 [Bodo saltans virus]ATZ80671.1 hypothetical protein BMW23_0625 [Bodo saltans virus]
MGICMSYIKKTVSQDNTISNLEKQQLYLLPCDDKNVTYGYKTDGNIYMLVKNTATVSQYIIMHTIPNTNDMCCELCNKLYKWYTGHCEKCNCIYDTYFENHCNKCCVTFSNMQKHCNECHTTIEHMQNHCTKCHMTTDHMQNHCCNCKCTIDHMQNHCTKCHTTTDHMQNHCCNCKCTYDFMSRHVCNGIMQNDMHITNRRVMRLMV